MLSPSSFKCCFTLGFLRRRSCSVENRFHPLVGDASPLMWSSEDGVSGKGGVQRDGARRKKLLVCVAMLYCSSHVSTMVNYGEI